MATALMSELSRNGRLRPPGEPAIASTLEGGLPHGQRLAAPAANRDAVIADFDALVSLYRPKVFRFIFASLRDREAAENLTQDSFIRAYKARHQFRGDSSISSWLLQIAVNLVRDHASNSRLKFWRHILRSDVELSDAREWVPDGQTSPEAMAMAKERVAAVWSATSKLPERQRTVFLLRFVEDMDLLEIATVTGLKEGTVKAHLFRALQSVRETVEGRK